MAKTSTRNKIFTLCATALLITFFALGSAVLLSGGGSGASKGNFLAATKKTESAHPGRFALAMPIPGAKSTHVIDFSAQHSEDYAVLHLMREQGLATRENTAPDKARFTITKKGQPYVIRSANGEVQVVIGHLVPHSVTSFTKPATQNGVNVSFATVELKPVYAKWVTKSGLKLMRDLAAAAGTQLDANNPARHDYKRAVAAALIGSAIGSHAAALLTENGSFSADQSGLADQINHYWFATAARSFSYRVPMTLNNNGWAADGTSKWKITGVKGLPAMTSKQIKAMFSGIRSEFTKGVKPAPEPNRKELAQALSSGGNLAIDVNTGLGGKGRRDCTAKYHPLSYYHSAGVNYSCASGRVATLNKMVADGIATRTVPKAGDVRYAVKPGFKAHLDAMGRLPIGSYAISSVSHAKETVNPLGFSLYRADVTLSPKIKSWAGSLAGTAQAKTEAVKLAHLDKGWTIASTGH